MRNDPTAVTRYMPRNTREAFKRIRADLWECRGLAWQLFVRDLSSRYRQSFLGFFWAFAPAVSTTALFTVAQKTRMIRVDATDIPYPVYVMIGTVLWQVFMGAFNAPSQALASSRALLARIRIVPETFLLVKLADVLFDFALKAVMVAVFCVYFGTAPGPSAFLAPLAFLHLLLFGIAAGLWLAPFITLSVDISKIVAVVTGFWFFVTPIVYTVPQSGWLRLAANVNPVTHLLVTARESMTGIPV